MIGALLVGWDCGVYGAGPGVYASCQGLDVLEALVAQPHGDVEGAGAVVAEDNDWGVRIEFGVGAGWHVPHGDQMGVGEVGGLVFPGLANVEQERRIGLLAALGEGFGGDFRF